MFVVVVVCFVFLMTCCVSKLQQFGKGPEGSSDRYES